MICHHLRGVARPWKVIGPKLASFGIPNGTRYTHSNNFGSEDYKVFGHGGPFWEDYYLLDWWMKNDMAVVNIGNRCGGYKLRRRIGHHCYLARKNIHHDNVAIKFLRRSNRTELEMNEFLQEHNTSPHICTMIDSFTIPHHLIDRDLIRRKINDGALFGDIKFTALVYPFKGTSLGRATALVDRAQGHGYPLSLQQRKESIRDIVRGVAALHQMGIVHGDIHAGNCALPPPPDYEIDNFLANDIPLQSEIHRRDGQETDRRLPRKVTEPIAIGYGIGKTTIIDFENSFHAKDGCYYGSGIFGWRSVMPPELSFGKTLTNLPFKVDSWHLGLCIYCILTDGAEILQRGTWVGKDTFRLAYSDRMLLIEGNQESLLNKLPREFVKGFRPILLSLLHHDPTRRASVQDLLENKWLMDMP